MAEATPIADQLATITEDEYSDFQARFQPIENQVIGSLFDTDMYNAKANSASSDVDSAFKNTMAQRDRTLSRAGVSLNDAQRKSSDRKAAIYGSAAKAGVENKTRQGLRDRDMNTAQQVINIGRGASATAQNGLQSAAGLENQQNVAYTNAMAQHNSNEMSMVGMGIGMALAF